jgi:DNA-nicking Smr family endonuclease
MRKKRKTKAAQESASQEKGPPKPVTIGSQLESALRTAGLEKLPDKKKKPSLAAAFAAAAAKKPASPAVNVPVPVPVPVPASPSPAARPRSPYTAGELAALGDAYRGARPIKRKSPVLHRVGPKIEPRPIDPLAIAADQEARARLGALIAGDVRFDVQLERDGYVQALRQGAARKLLTAVQGSSFGPDAQLDLHGMHGPEAARAVHDFVRNEHRRGARRLLIIVGKGNHSEAGVSVLGPIARDALTRGGAAPLVQAFATAHATLGGRGALAVLLR